MNSLGFRLVTTIGGVVAVAVLALSSAAYFDGRSAISAEIGERVAATTRAAGSATDAYLDARVQEIREMATSSLTMTSLTPVDRAKLFSDYANAFGSNRYADLELLDAAGRTVAENSGSPSFEREPAMLKKFAAATRAGITPLTTFPDLSTPAFVVYAPIIDENGKRSGTLTARLLTTELAAMLRAFPVDDDASLGLLFGPLTIALHSGTRGPALTAQGALVQRTPAGGTLQLILVTAVDRHAAYAPVFALAMQCGVLGLAALAVAGCALIFVARRVGRPLREVAQAAIKLADGDLDAGVHIRSGVRETAELAGAFNAMSLRLRDLIGGFAIASGTISASAEVTIASSRSLRSRSEETARASNRIVGVLRDVGQGARMIERQVETLEHGSRESLLDIAALHREVDSTNAALSQLREELERSNTAGLALAQHADGVAVRAREVADSATGAAASASAGGAAVYGLIGEVRGVGSSLAETSVRLERLAASTSLAITAQLEVIEDIADRSKLLALNAGIEAARAGTVGRGFSIIAVELHNLASASRVASDEVKKQVKRVVGEAHALVEGTLAARVLVDAAIERAELTGATIDALVTEIGENAGRARAIGEIARDQALRSAEIGVATGEMRSMAIATAQAASRTAELSERVRSSVERATEVAAHVLHETRGQAEAVSIIEGSASEIDRANHDVAQAAQLALGTTEDLRREIERLDDRIVQYHHHRQAVVALN